MWETWTHELTRGILKMHYFGVIESVWVARRPPGYAFIDFEDRRDAEDAIREIDGMCEGFSSFYIIFLVFYACFYSS